MRSPLALVMALLALAGAVHGVNRTLETSLGTRAELQGVGPLPDGKTVRVLSLGFDRLLADLFWLRTIYYIGDESLQATSYPDLGRLANLVTDVDPQFTTAYVVMSGAISGLAGDPDGSIALLEKGVANVRYWKLHFLLGFDYFIERLDYASAARHMQAAADLGGPSYLSLLATRLYAQAGDPATALAFIQARLKDEQDDETRQALEKRYWDLWIARDLERIDAAIAEYRAKNGRDAQRIADLVAGGQLQEEPRDPRGGSYGITNGKASTDLPHDALKLNVPYKPTRRDLDQQYQKMRAEQDGGVQE